MKIPVSLKPSIFKKLKQQAKINGRSLEAEAQRIIETWFVQNIEASLKMGEELGQQLGEGIANAFDEAIQDFAAGKNSKITVRVKSAKEIKNRRKKND